MILGVEIKETCDAVFIRRLNRFLAEIEVKSKIILAHVPNSARLLELLESNTELLVTKNEGLKSKTEYKIYAVRKNDNLISIDSIFPNIIFKECISSNLLPEFAGWKIKKNEYLINDSKIDFLLYKKKDEKVTGACSSPTDYYKDQELRLVELKSCSMVVDGVALFPDSPTTRCLRHVRTLAESFERGFNPHIIWIIQRNDANYFSINNKIQPELEKFI